MLSALRIAARIGFQTSTLGLIVLGLTLIPVQCSLGLHSIFVAAPSPVAAAPAHETHQQHAAGHHGSQADDAPADPMSPSVQAQPRVMLAGQARAPASEQSTPSPVPTATVDHPYTVALGRVIPGVDLLEVHLRPLILTTLAPDAMAIAPDPPPPRAVI